MVSKICQLRLFIRMASKGSLVSHLTVEPSSLSPDSCYLLFSLNNKHGSVSELAEEFELTDQYLLYLRLNYLQIIVPKRVAGTLLLWRHF